MDSASGNIWKQLQAMHIAPNAAIASLACGRHCARNLLRKPMCRFQWSCRFQWLCRFPWYRFQSGATSRQARTDARLCPHQASIFVSRARARCALCLPPPPPFPVSLSLSLSVSLSLSLCRHVQGSSTCTQTTSFTETSSPKTYYFPATGSSNSLTSVPRRSFPSPGTPPPSPSRSVGIDP
jgi:hypothetical protein